MNITYFLGAGASANALKPVNGMKQSIEQLAVELSELLPSNLSQEAFAALPEGIRNRIKDLEHLITELKWVISESRHHATVDTLAKRFFLLEKWDELRRLKAALIVYFTLRQLSVYDIHGLRNNPAPSEKTIDGRYDSLIAAYARKGAQGPELPSNLKVISWNYDLQPELALKRYFPLNIEDLQQRLQIWPNSTMMASGNTFNMDRFGLVKLNGNALWGKLSTPGCTTHNTLFDRFYDDNPALDVLIQLLHEYHELRVDRRTLNNALTYFNFAWESDENFKDKHSGFDQTIQAAVEIAKKTDVLVVIGYSFPIFNRETDSTVFNHLLQLQKVYIQDLNAEQIKLIMTRGFPIFERGTTINLRAKWQGDQDIHLSRQIEQFLIPT